MGTSCIYGFYKDGNLKVDYNNMDSYPSGFGKHVVSFIRENSVEELHEIYDKTVLVPRKGIPSKTELEEIKKKKMCISFSEGEILDWEMLSVINEGFLEHYKIGGYFMPDFSEWLHHYQDWVYIINLDDDTFEVYNMKHSGDKEEDDLEKHNRYKEKYK